MIIVTMVRIVVSFSLPYQSAVEVIDYDITILIT
jgi:hypothetical protein